MAGYREQVNLAEDESINNVVNEEKIQTYKCSNFYFEYSAFHFGPARWIFLGFWSYLMQNGLWNMFLMVKNDTYFNKVWEFSIQRFSDISCSPFCLPVSWLGGDQTFTLFNMKAVWCSDNSWTQSVSIYGDHFEICHDS